MNKKDHVNFWLRTGHQSWEAGILLMHGKKNVEALFMFCLAIEKFVKANWVNDNIDNIPPRIHDLQSVYSQTDIELEPDLVDFLDTINTEEYISRQFENLTKLKQCLLEGL